MESWIENGGLGGDKTSIFGFKIQRVLPSVLSGIDRSDRNPPITGI